MVGRLGGRPTRLSGGEGRDRTADTAVFSRVLYRLSYLPGTSDRQPRLRVTLPAHPTGAVP
jgi:hypothetical protein